MNTSAFKVLLEINVKDRSQAAQQAAKSVRDVGTAISEMDKQISLWTQKRTGQEFFKFGQMMTGGLSDAVKSAADLEDAYRSLAFAMDKSPESASFNVFTQDLTRLGLELGQTKREIIDFAREVFQAGAVNEESALKSVRAIALYQSATGMATKELAQNVMKINAQFNGIGGEGLPKLLNTIVVASKKLPATPGFIQDSLQYVGTMGKIAGFTEEQLTSLLGVIALSTKSSSKVANVVNRTLRNLGDSKNQGAMGSLLGLTKEEIDSMSDRKKEGMLMALNKFLTLIKGKGIPQVTAIMSKLGITAGLDAAALLTAADQLESLNKIIKETEESVATMDPTATLAADRFKSFSGQAERLSDALGVLKDQVGKEFLGEGTLLLNLMNNLVDSISELSPGVKKLVGILAGVGGFGLQGLGGTVAFLAQVGLARASIVQSIGAMRKFSTTEELQELNARIGHTTIPLIRELGATILSGPVMAMRRLIEKVNVFSGLINRIPKFGNFGMADGRIGPAPRNQIPTPKGGGMMQFMVGTSNLLSGLLRSSLKIAGFLGIITIVIAAVEGILQAFGLTTSDIFKAISVISDVIVGVIATTVGTIVNVLIEIYNWVIGMFNGKKIEWRSQSGFFNDSSEDTRYNLEKGHTTVFDYLPEEDKAAIIGGKDPAEVLQAAIKRADAARAAKEKEAIAANKKSEESSKKIDIDWKKVPVIDSEGNKIGDLEIVRRVRSDKPIKQEEKPTNSGTPGKIEAHAMPDVAEGGQYYH